MKQSGQLKYATGDDESYTNMGTNDNQGNVEQTALQDDISGRQKCVLDERNAERIRRGLDLLLSLSSNHRFLSLVCPIYFFA